MHEVVTDAHRREQLSDLHLKTGLFEHLARGGVLRCLAVLDPAAGHRPQPLRWRMPAPDEQQPAFSVPYDGPRTWDGRACDRRRFPFGVVRGHLLKRKNPSNGVVMLVLLIVIAAVVLLALVLSFGGGLGGFGGPVVHRRVVYRRPVRRVITEHHIVEEPAVSDPIDRPVYRP